MGNQNQQQKKLRKIKIKKKAQNAFRKKNIYKRIPIFNWLPKYSTADAVGDVIAGITVGLTVIPQALAYAGIAHLPPESGLYGSFLGCFIYIFLGSCKDVPMGPTAIASLCEYQTNSYFINQGADTVCGQKIRDFSKN